MYVSHYGLESAYFESCKLDLEISPLLYPRKL